MPIATDPPSASLHLDLHFELRLMADGPQPAWQAQLGGTCGEPPLHFRSMGELIRYLARLDLQTPPPRGIR